MTTKKLAKKALFLLLALSLITPHFFFGFPTPVKAAQLNSAFLRLDRMTASTATGGTVCLMIDTTGSTDAHVEVTFPADFTVNGTAGNWTVTTTNLPLGATAMPGVNTAENVTGQTVRFPITDISSDSTLYCFNFSGTSTLTTSTAGNDKTGSITTTTGADAPIDTADYATAVIANDQVLITATVPPTFSFSLSTNAQALGVLTTGGVTSGTGVDVAFGTNAGHGWIGWVKSANAALNSVASGGSIPATGSIDASPSTVNAGTAGYVIDADLDTDSGTSGTGTVTISAEYDGASTSQGGTPSLTFQDFATADGPTDGDTITLIPRVTISALTPAGTDYTDTWTVVGAANF